MSSGYLSLTDADREEMLAAIGVALRSDPPIVALDLMLAGIATLAWAICTSGQSLTRQGAAIVAALGALAAA